MPDSLVSPVQQPFAIPEAAVPSCAVLVMSCDAYRDLWRPFFTLFWRYWPDCPFPVFLGSTQATYDDARVTTLAAGDFAWSKTLRTCLERIDADYVLLLLEDYFLKSRISTASVLRALTCVHALQGTVLRLYPHPGPDAGISELSDIGRIHARAPYRISTQPAIWNRAELLRIPRDQESIWQFESEGTRRSRADPAGFYATYNARFAVPARSGARAMVSFGGELLQARTNRM